MTFGSMQLLLTTTLLKDDYWWLNRESSEINIPAVIFSGNITLFWQKHTSLEPSDNFGTRDTCNTEQNKQTVKQANVSDQVSTSAHGTSLYSQGYHIDYRCISKNTQCQCELLLADWVRRRFKGGYSTWIVSSPFSHLSPISWTTQSCSLWLNWFSKCEHPFIDETMVMIESAVPSPWFIIGLGFATVS